MVPVTMSMSIVQGLPSTMRLSTDIIITPYTTQEREDSFWTPSAITHFQACHVLEVSLFENRHPEFPLVIGTCSIHEAMRPMRAKIIIHNDVPKVHLLAHHHTIDTHFHIISHNCLAQEIFPVLGHWGQCPHEKAISDCSLPNITKTGTYGVAQTNGTQLCDIPMASQSSKSTQNIPKH